MVKWPCLKVDSSSGDDAKAKNHLNLNDATSRHSKARKEGGAFITRASHVPTKLVKYNTTAPLWDQERRSTAVHHAEVLIARQKHNQAEAGEQEEEETENQNTIVAPGLPEVTKVQRLITFGHQRQAGAEEAISLQRKHFSATPDDIPLLQTVPGDTAKYITPVLEGSNRNVEDRDDKDGSFQSQQNLRKALFRENALEYSSSSEEESSSEEQEDSPPPTPTPTPLPTPKPTPIPTPKPTPVPSIPKPESPEEEESSSSEESPPPSPPKSVVVLVPHEKEESSSSESPPPSPPKPIKVPTPPEEEEESSSEEEEEEEPPPPPIPKKEEPRPCPPAKTDSNNNTCGLPLFDFDKINESLWETRKLLFGDCITMVKPCPPPPPPPPPPEPNCGCGTEDCDCCCCSCDCCDENANHRDENNNVTKAEKKVAFPVSPPKPLLTPPLPPRPPPTPVTVQQAMTHTKNPPPHKVPATGKKPHPCRPRSKNKKQRSKSRSKSRSKPKKKCKPQTKKQTTTSCGGRGASSGCCGGKAAPGGGGCCGPPRMACGCCLYEESSSSSSSSDSEDDGIRPGVSFPTEFLWFMLTMNSTSQYYKLNSSYQANYCAAIAREKYEAAQKPHVNTVDVGCLEEIVCQQGEELLRNKELAITLRHFPKDSNCLPQNPLIDLNSMKLFTSGEKETECCCKRKCCGKGKCGGGKIPKEKDKHDKDEESDEEEEEESESDEEEEDSDEKGKTDNKKKAHNPHSQPPPSQLNSSPPAQYLVNCNNLPGYTPCPPQPIPMQPCVPSQPCYPQPCVPPQPCYPTCYSSYPPCPPGAYCYPPPCYPPPWAGAGGPQSNPNDFGGDPNGYDGANGYDDYGDEYYGNEYDENYDDYEGEGDYYDGDNEYGNGGNMRSCDNDPRVLEWNRNKNAPNNGGGRRGSNNSNGSNDQADAHRTVSFNQAARARGSKDSSYLITLDPLGNYVRTSKKEYNAGKPKGINPNGNVHANKGNARDSNVSNSSSLNVKVVRGSKDITNHKIY